MVDLLLEHGADPGQVCADGKAALHYAAQMGHEAIVVRLLKALGDDCVKQPDAAKWLPLHYAAQQGSLPVVRMFLEVCPPGFAPSAWLGCLRKVLLSKHRALLAGPAGDFQTQAQPLLHQRPTHRVQ